MCSVSRRRGWRSQTIRRDSWRARHRVGCTVSRRGAGRPHQRPVDDPPRRVGGSRYRQSHAECHLLRILTLMAFKTGQDLIDEAKGQIEELTPEQVRDMQARNEQAVYLDVREPNEWNLGRLPHAIHLPRGNLESKVEGLVDRAQKVVIYCARGNRSALAALTLKQMGYENVASMSRGIQGWAEI